MKLQKRFLLYFSLIGLLVISSISIYIGLSIKNGQIENYQLIQNRQMELTTSTILSLVEKVETDLTLMSSDNLTQRYFAEDESSRYRLFFTALNKSLQRYTDINEHYIESSIVLPNGFEDVYTSKGLVNAEEFDAFVPTLHGNFDFEKQTLVGNIVYNDEINRWLLSYYYPIYLYPRAVKSDSNPIVAYSKISLSLQKILQSLSDDQFHTSIIYDNEIIQPTNVNNATTGRTISHVIPVRTINSAQLAVEVLIQSWLSHSNYLVIKIFSVLMVIILSLLLVIYWLLNKMILSRLSKFTETIEGIDDKLSKPFDFEFDHDDEIGILKSEFNNLLSRLKYSKNILEEQAYTDQLTGLGNRAAMYQLLETKVSINIPCSLLFLDLDGFKQVNDLYGHDAGDGLLVEVANRLKDILRSDHKRESDTVLRLGGDEFTVIINDDSSAQSVAKKIVKEMGRAFEVEDRNIYIGVSVGIAYYPLHGQDVTKLVSHADLAMYQAKRNGKKHYQVFSQYMVEDEKKNHKLENSVRYAIENNTIAAWLQPKVEVETGQIVGFESLARMFDQDNALISPVDFIPVAEEQGALDYVSMAVLEQSCQVLKKLGNEQLTAAINLSPNQLKDIRLLSEMRFIMWQYNIEAHRIEIEVTENQIIQNESEAEKNLKLLKLFGFKTSLDDFGVGYSSLGHLKRFDFDTLKLDRIFVSDAGFDTDSAKAIMTAIIQMANSLHMNIVAEGVEDENQLQLIKELGVPVVQGFIYSKPLPCHEFVNLYQASTEIKLLK